MRLTGAEISAHDPREESAVVDAASKPVREADRSDEVVTASAAEFDASGEGSGAGTTFEENSVVDGNGLEPAPEAAAPPPAAFAIDFGSALATAAGQNPRVAFAHARIREAYAQLQAADVLWLPDLNAGASAYRHDGSLQPAAGQVEDISRGAYFAGLGSRAAGTSVPSFPGLFVEFHAADAYFQPRIAGHTAIARRQEATATGNDVLLDTAMAYLELLRALQARAIAEQTRRAAGELEELTRNFARAGEGPQADADRALTELMARRSDLLEADEAIRIASARLAQQLSLDATVPLRPREPRLVPIELVSPDANVHELLQTALATRPELAGSRRLVAAACERLRRERTAPLVPSLLLGTSYGGFGGGRNDDNWSFGDRFDFDAAAYWNVRSLGFGERAARREARAELDQARAEVVRTMDQVVREVVEGHAQVELRSRRIAIARDRISSAEDAFRRDVQRIRQGEGQPIEAVQSLRALDAARRAYLRAVAEYDEAQFRLQRAIGWPIAAAPGRPAAPRLEETPDAAERQLDEE